MKISLIAILRNAENYLKNFLLNALNDLEKLNPNIDFYYYFYENDSVDDTKILLSEFIKKRKGKLLCENNQIPVFQRNIDRNRIENIAQCRNKLLELRPFEGEWTILLDADIVFPPNILTMFFTKNLPSDLVVLSVNGKDHVKCTTHHDCNHYYDILALIDNDSVCGFNYSAIHNTQCCHLSLIEDRKKWFNNELVEVKSAFGGLSFYKTNILNLSNLIYKIETPLTFIKTGEKIYCEHWDFLEKIREYGKIYISPDLIVHNKEL